MLVPSRRSFLTGLGALIAAPAIVQVTNLMPVKVVKPLTFADYSAVLNDLLALRMKECERLVAKQIEDSVLYGQSGPFGPTGLTLGSGWPQMEYIDVHGVSHVA